MKKWLYKTLSISVAVLTLGFITPTHEIWQSLEADEQNTIRVHEVSENDISSAFQLDTLLEDSSPSIDGFIGAAKNQSYIKFGSRISPVIENEFEHIIFPKMQEAIVSALMQVDKEQFNQLEITHNPSGEYAEKIFNITDTVTKKDLIRFHVRTENRPFDGYYYNFHYHLAADQYATHYNLGEIYWSKNQPPKWLS